MNLLTFILINAAFAVVDGIVTFTISNGFDLPVVCARLCSGAITLALLGFALTRIVPVSASSSSPSPTLIAIISILGTGLSCGLFNLILSRNPFVQWPVAFAASAFASLIFASLAYRRAQTR